MLRVMQRFKAKLEPVSHGGHYVTLPAKTAEAAGIVHADRVRGTVNGEPFRSSAVKYSGVFHVGIHKATLAKAAVKSGALVAITIELDPEPLPADVVPDDLAKALGKSKAIAAAWERLRPSHKREHVKAILDAKKPETRARRIANAIAMLREKST